LEKSKINTSTVTIKFLKGAIRSGKVLVVWVCGSEPREKRTARKRNLNISPETRPYGIGDTAIVINTRINACGRGLRVVDRHGRRKDNGINIRNGSGISRRRESARDETIHKGVERWRTFTIQVNKNAYIPVETGIIKVPVNITDL
jgi:hypothetical protein